VNHFSWIMSEVFYRKGQALLFILAVAMAMLLTTGTLALIAVDETRTREHFTEQERVCSEQMNAVRDEYRKMTKDLGFNVLILPEGQDLADFYADDFASKYMPQHYADSLACSNVITVEHILPTLMQRTYWKEKNRSILVCGVRDELPRAKQPPGAKKKKTLLPAVPRGSVVCGSELCSGLSLHPDDTITFMGKRFRVAACHAERGNRDDITMWMELDVAQELFGRQGQINGIMALECRCAADGRFPNIAKIRTAMAQRLPGTRVIEFMSKVIARAEARQTAVETQQHALELEKKDAMKRLDRRHRSGVLFVLIVTVMVLAVTMFLAVLNFRSRMREAAVLRAIGFTARSLFFFFESRTILLGLAGTVCGILPVTFALAVSGRFTDLFPATAHPGILPQFALIIVAGMVPALAVCSAAAILYGLSRPVVTLLERNGA